MYINKAILFGNLTRDPELRALPSGMNVCNFSIATNRTYKDRDGKKQEQTDFHNVVVFGRQADTVSQYLKKGAGVFVEGRIQTRSWESPEKGKQYRTEIVAERVQFGPRSTGSRQGDEGPFTPSKVEGQRAPKEEGIEYPEEDINPDDIPF